MKIKDAATKVFIRELFIEEKDGMLVNGQRQVSERKFSFEKLADVISINKKLFEGTKADTENPTLIRFADNEIEFTPSEIAIIVDLFALVKEWPISKAEQAIKMSDLLNGKPKEVTKK